jgi:hypothetical protein
MRRIVNSAMAAAVLAAAAAGATSAALAAGHDGSWSVLVVTEKGECDRAYRYEVTIVDGRLSYAGGGGFNILGTVSPNGAVKVSISAGDRNAQGTGRISADNGAGTRHGAGSTGLCAGSWETARR